MRGVFGCKKTARLGSAMPLRVQALIAGLFCAMAAGTAGAVAAGQAGAGFPAFNAVTSLSSKTAHGTALELVTALSPSAGSYSGTNPQNGSPLRFYVSSSRTTVQDISIPSVGLACTPEGGAIPEPFAIAAVAIKSSGSFTATTTETGVVSGQPATFSYTFRGNFHSAAKASGTFRETVKFGASPVQTCTSNTQSWSATRDTQPRQTTSPPPAGSYSATNPQNGSPLTFYVSSSRTKLQDISIPSVGLACAPEGGAIPEPFSIATAAIKSDRSFTATTTETGVVSGSRATFSYTFRGNFHSVGPSGAERAAGTFRETVKFNSSAPQTCTSNTQSWSATRDTQPRQTTSPPPAGSYSATNPQNGSPLTFSVSSSRTKLQDISIPSVGLACAPEGGAIPEPFSIATAAIKSDRSFTATKTQHGVVSGQPATFTYTFRGNFHSLAPSGAERAAGTFRETVKFNAGGPQTCTSNTQSWTATRTG
jgi:hypothetical protein